MKKLMIAAQGLMFAGLMLSSAARADQIEIAMVETEMTPVVVEAPKVAKKVDSRFMNYELENFGCCGQQ
jgi:hypothetical protein